MRVIIEKSCEALIMLRGILGEDWIHPDDDHFYWEGYLYLNRN
ncbi:unnamed protein product [marine sediment metagenome]|uniref:Uncharacterized protein n=1 Tax=marine sediment metagenome TaxID=412755 RepID=X1JZC7_9ZZZZ